MEKIKAPVITKKKTVATIQIIAITREKTIATIETPFAVKIAATIGNTALIRTMAKVVEVPKVFKKMSIIAVEDKFATMVAKTLKKSSVATFNKREKYIQINYKFAAFV